MVVEIIKNGLVVAKSPAAINVYKTILKSAAGGVLAGAGKAVMKANEDNFLPIMNKLMKKE